ncbi:MAG: YebC/PmpR family DNA-binding transcriptional regulator [Proteobacteria bacterium]|nr:YebC/PmpR family DNA-binding transcriptional regulator [Pseudomonadota bacterium]
MSGHNKWSKVKNIKGPLDAKKGKLFTKLSKEITVAARLGGGNTDGNARLRHAIVEARSASMPKDTIERAIKKGTGELEGDVIEEITYEGYGPGGVALLVETITDNKNRTVNDLRNIFKSSGGSLGESGSVAWMFNRFGQLLFEAKKHSEERLMEVALEAGAQDVSTDSEGITEVLTGVADLYRVRENFERLGMLPSQACFSFVAKSTVPLNKTNAQELIELINEIEDHDDVQRVHSNGNIDEKILAELSQK